MLNYLQYFIKNIFKKIMYTIMYIIYIIYLTSCSSDITEYVFKHNQYKEKELNKIQSIQSIQNYYLNNNFESYKILKGDTLYSISRKYNTTVKELNKINKINKYSLLQISQNILVPQDNSIKKPINNNIKYNNINISKNNKFQDKLKHKKLSNLSLTKKNIYIVKPKDTLYAISRRYNINYKLLKKINNFSDTKKLKIGQIIYINNIKKIELNSNVFKNQKKIQEQLIIQDKFYFRWPINGRVISEYGLKKNGLRNNGINIAAPPGTKVKASESGIIVYSNNNLPNYGNLILIKHKKNLITAYAHNKILLVKKGDKVHRGQIIAKSGQSGNIKLPQLHFEIRSGIVAINPRKYLTKQ